MLDSCGCLVKVCPIFIVILFHLHVLKVNTKNVLMLRWIWSFMKNFAKYWQFLLIWRSFLWKPTLCTLPLSKQYPRKNASFLFLFPFYHALHLIKHLLMELIYKFVFFVARDYFLVYFTLVKQNTGHIVCLIQHKTTSLGHSILVCTWHESCFFRIYLVKIEVVLESTLSQ